MAEKRQKKQAAKAFEKETFSKDKEVTGAKHTEHRQDNTFFAENQYSAREKPVSHLPRDANHGSHRRNATSGHSVQKWKGNDMESMRDTKRIMEREIKKELQMKLDRITMRSYYTKYKTAETEQEREEARKKYLDEKGVPKSFRW